MAESLLVGRNFVSGICKLKSKKNLNLKTFKKLVKNLGFTSPAGRATLTERKKTLLFFRSRGIHLGSVGHGRT